MTDRIIKVMHHLSVDIIGDLTCRLLGDRDPVDLESHLQIRRGDQRLTGEPGPEGHPRYAGQGPWSASDYQPGLQCHRSLVFHAPRGGMARRGWCSTTDILNTRPVEEFLSFLPGKM